MDALRSIYDQSIKTCFCFMADFPDSVNRAQRAGAITFSNYAQVMASNTYIHMYIYTHDTHYT